MRAPFFQARLAPLPTHASSRIEPGARVAVTGICAVQLGRLGRFTQGGQPESFRLLVRAPQDIRVLRAPPWWTTRRMLWALGGSGIVFLLAMAWALALQKRNAVLREQVKARRRAEASLRKMHTELEERVEQRSEQLRAEISARHEAEAVLEERNRLASELHDTLEQGLTGIALQLEAATRAPESAGATSRRHVELARTMIRQSQAEVRRSVWNLRSQLLDEHRLAEAIRITVGQTLAEAGLQFRFRQTGEMRRLPEVVENNLLRLVQEAVTNALKHARAATLSVRLDYQPEQLRLTIEDDGCGFDDAELLTLREGHFGLQGMQERVKRIAGELRIRGRVGVGAVIEVTVPLRPPLAAGRAD
jgi:signal transduction histidine kinase